MKILEKIKWLGIAILFTYALANANVHEYGIVIILEEKCLKYAETLNGVVAKNLPDLENVPNHPHVTLYHGAFNDFDLSKIKNLISALKPQEFDLKFTKFYTTSDRWVDWKVEKTSKLQLLHESIVEALSPFHVRPLKRSADVYSISGEETRGQIDKYGVSGVMNLYNPHTTLFYAYPPNSSLKNIPKIIGSEENISCKTSKIAIGKLGYNGNIIEIIHTVNFIHFE